MVESRPAGQTKGGEVNTQAAEAGTGFLGRAQGRCRVVQGLHQEGQGTAGAELDKGLQE